MSRRFHLLAVLLSVLLLPGAARAQVGGEFETLEQHVVTHPREPDARRRLAAQYAASGFVEEAAEQYLAILKLDPTDRDARPALEALLARQMPRWLPATTARVEPFALETVKLALPDAPGAAVEYAFLLTTQGFAAREGERQDRLQGGRFSRIAYGYVWDKTPRRWQLKVRVHSQTEKHAALAQQALRLTLALYGTVRATLDLDPTRSRRPIDIWVCDDGPPGARANGSAIYLYAVKTERVPEEWVRELAHEYGHLSLPGVGGFTNTDDPWADGELGELLFVKWLAAAKAEWLPWSVPAAEKTAAARRAELMAKAPRPDAKLLAGKDEAARAHLLGLALRVEVKAGPRFLAEALGRCPRGDARRFVAETGKLARTRHLTVW